MIYGMQRHTCGPLPSRLWHLGHCCSFSTGPNIDRFDQSFKPRKTFAPEGSCTYKQQGGLTQRTDPRHCGIHAYAKSCSLLESWLLLLVQMKSVGAEQALAELTLDTSTSAYACVKRFAGSYVARLISAACCRHKTLIGKVSL